MSYARTLRRGFGDAGTVAAGLVASQKAGPSVGAALKSVVSDTGLMNNLSPEAQGVVGILSVVVSNEIGPIVNAAEQQISQLTADSLNEITSTVSSVTDAIPLINMAVGLITNAISGFQAAFAREEAAANARCVQMFSRLKAIPLYSDTVRPAELFARFIDIGDTGADVPVRRTAPLPLDAPEPTMGPQRSLLGQYLIMLTEDIGGNAAAGTGADPDQGAVYGPKAKGFGGNANLAFFFRKAMGRKITDMPAARRAQFKAVRKAIEAQVGVGDGGQSLWLLYIDMLRDAFAQGWLSEDWIRFLASAGTNCGYDPDNPSACRVSSDSGYWMQCPQTITAHTGVAEQVLDIVRVWTNKVLHPSYDDDKAARTKMLAMIAQAQASLAGSKMRLNLGPTGAALMACVKAKGTWKNNTCATTRQGVRWDTKSLSFVPVPLLVMQKPTSPFLAIAFGVAIVGSIAWMAQHRKRAS